MNDNPALLIANYDDEDKEVTKEMIETVANMGFPRDIAEAALTTFKGNIEKCLGKITLIFKQTSLKILFRAMISQSKINKSIYLICLNHC